MKRFLAALALLLGLCTLADAQPFQPCPFVTAGYLRLCEENGWVK